MVAPTFQKASATATGTCWTWSGECGGTCTADADADGICDDVDDCIGAVDFCGVCNGPGAIYECGCADIPEGDCNCLGSQEDAIGVCGGDCAADEDGDGVCDDVDDCVGEIDACGLCNGPGAVYDCGCADIPEGDCDCNGNQLDAVGVCGGTCPEDADADGVCDDVDDCIGVFDACGVCNGPGDIYECGCADIPEGDCNCNGAQLDAIGVCGGVCPADLNNNGICDTEEECAGFEDECNVCFGPGAIYECGCFDIPEGDCDCDGNQLDALGVCGGPCEADVDADGVCDVDEIFGCTDEAPATTTQQPQKTTALAPRWTNVACVAALASPLANAIVTETSSTNVACVAERASPLVRATAMATCLTNVAFAVAMEATVLAAWKRGLATTTLTPCFRTGHANT